MVEGGGGRGLAPEALAPATDCDVAGEEAGEAANIPVCTVVGRPAR